MTPDEQLLAVLTLYSNCREILDNIAVELIDWHGTISKEQFLECFAGLEELIPECLLEGES